MGGMRDMIVSACVFIKMSDGHMNASQFWRFCEELGRKIQRKTLREGTKDSNCGATPVITPWMFQDKIYKPT